MRGTKPQSEISHDDTQTALIAQVETPPGPFPLVPCALVHAGGALVHAAGALVHAGGALVHAGGALVHAAGALVHAGVSLSGSDDALPYFGVHRTVPGGACLDNHFAGQ